jgi:hypothetical protein
MKILIASCRCRSPVGPCAALVIGGSGLGLLGHQTGAPWCHCRAWAGNV